MPLHCPLSSRLATVLCGILVVAVQNYRVGYVSLKFVKMRFRADATLLMEGRCGRGRDNTLQFQPMQVAIRDLWLSARQTAAGHSASLFLALSSHLQEAFVPPRPPPRRDKCD